MQQPYNTDHFFAAIIGGGPAGAQCAIWLNQMNIPAVFFEKSPSLGGQQNGISDASTSHYVVASAGRHAKQISSAINYNLSRNGVNFLCNVEVTSVKDEGEWFKLVVSNSDEVNTIWVKHIVLATGAAARKAGFIESDSVLIGSADPRIREGNFFAGKSVAILGGGDGAFECYSYLRGQKPKNMMIFARHVRAKAKFRSLIEPHDLLQGGYTVFVGDKTHVITDNEDPYSRYAFDYLIVNYGVEAVRVLDKELDPPRNKLGFVIVDDQCVSKNPRILAIGEATQRMHPCVATSMADGTIAAKTLEAKFNQPWLSQSQPT